LKHSGAPMQAESTAHINNKSLTNLAWSAKGEGPGQ